jgi:dipeptidyl aminopeptidase/acylaminoacyl peptidase
VTTTAPFGSWQSPITAAALVEQSVGLSDFRSIGTAFYWSELRPNDGARQVLVRQRRGGEPEDLLDAPYSARSLVHEYGGRCYAVAADDTVYFSNHRDQRIYRLVAGSEPEPLTAAPESERSVRYADCVLTPDGRYLVAVRERHGVGGGSGAEAVINDLVAISLDDGGAHVLAAGRDFYSAPRIAPDGGRLAFVCWDHPNMPWDGTELFVGTLDARGQLGAVTAVAGGAAEAVSQPRFNADGLLHFLSDRSGYSLLYTENGDCLVASGLQFDLGGADWTFGQSSYACIDRDRAAVVAEVPDGQRLGIVTGGELAWLPLPFSALSSLSTDGDRLFAIAGSAVDPAALVEIDLASGATAVLHRSRTIGFGAQQLASPQAIEFPTADGRHAYALYYPPTNPDFAAPAGELPPLVVQSHGGPTSKTSPALNLRTQYLTSRGIAVVEVNYGGSSGFGRDYRQRLQGKWGIVDVDDCAHAAGYLASQGLADPARLAIHGGSAGGFTTLAALCFTDLFAAGASHFGVSDLAALASDTHKFESRYLDGLVGPFPAAAATYEERSPIHHVDQFSCPVIFFQGLEDEIVPPDQAERMVGALRARDIPVAYLAFADEQHGFRRAETIVAVAEAELGFFGEVLGFTPADELPRLLEGDRG